MADVLPEVGNLAWAPLPAFEEVEVLDRFNGVPTLGVFGAPGDRALFWRALGYVPLDEISIWIYVPLSAADEAHLDDADSSDLLNGIVFRSSAPRAARVGVAHDYRLVLEYPWQLPADLPAENLTKELIRFLASAITGSLDQALAPHRKRAARKASKAIKGLAAV